MDGSLDGVGHRLYDPVILLVQHLGEDLAAFSVKPGRDGNLVGCLELVQSVQGGFAEALLHELIQRNRVVQEG